MTTPDIPLLRKAVDWADAEDALSRREPAYRSRWMQLCWRSPVTVSSDGRCSTAFCIAGYVVEASPTARWASDDPADVELYQKVLIDGSDKPYHPQDAAEHLLGITDDQGDRLFAGLNTIRDVHRVATRIAGEPL